MATKANMNDLKYQEISHKRSESKKSVRIAGSMDFQNESGVMKLNRSGVNVSNMKEDELIHYQNELAYHIIELDAA